MYDNDFDDENPELDGFQPPSKSQRKREATALQDLGEQLVKLTPTQLRRIPLPEELLEAVRMAQSISQRGGRKRQLQFIGKLMRQIDDPEPIRSALTALLAPRHSS